MAVAAGGGDVEARRDVPAEVLVELVVGPGFGQHGGCGVHPGFFVMAGAPGHPRLCARSNFRDVDARDKSEDALRAFAPGMTTRGDLGARGTGQAACRSIATSACRLGRSR